MSINSVNPIAIAAPYSGISGLVSASKASDKFELSNNEVVTSAEERRSRVGAAEGVNFKSNEQRRQQAQRRVAPIFIHEKHMAMHRTLPGPEILGELISRMGGAGVYSGPGQVVNITV